MTEKVSEALRLFQMEHRFDSGEMPKTSHLRDLTAVKPHHLLPEIPPVWSSSTPSLAHREITTDPLESEELIFDFYLSHFIRRLFDNIEAIIREDLVARFSKASAFELWGLNTPEKKYEYLRKKFPDFQPQEIETSNREEQEIYVIRLNILGTIPLEELRKSAKESPWPYPELKETIKEHLDQIFNLLQFEMARLDMKFNLPTETEKKLQNWSDRTSIILLHPRKEVAFNPSEIPKPDKINLRPARKEFVKIVEEQEKLGFPITPHKAQESYFSNVAITSISHFKEIIFGGPFGKLGAIIGLKDILSRVFSLKGKVQLDLASRRQKELIKGMKKIHKTVVAGVNVILSQLHEMDKHIAKLSRNQQILETRLIATHELLDTHRRETLASLAKISHDTILARLALNAILDGPGMLCNEVRRRMESDPSFHPYFNRFVSYHAFAQFYKREKFALQKGLEGLYTTFMSPGRNDAAFFMHAGTAPQDYLFFDHYAELWGFYKEAFKNWEGRKLFELLLLPEGEKGNIETASLPEWIEESLNFTSLDPLLARPYNTEKTIDYGRSAHAFHYFYELLSDASGSPLVSLDQVEEHRPSPQGLRLLQNAFLRVEIAIAEANILVGSHLLTTLHEKMKEKKNEKILSLVGTNYLLAQNLMIYSFRETMKEKGRAFTDYYFAYFSHENPYYLQTLLGTHWKFVWKNKGWGIECFEGGDSIPLPKPLDVARGTFLSHPHLADLFQLRRMLLREMAGYQSQDLKEAPQNAYYAGLILTTLYFRNFINKNSGESHDNAPITSKL